MTLLQLSYFVKVCECHSMTKAAINLHISQPAITKTIQELEKEFNVKLLIRQKSGQELTYEGQKLYENALRLLNQAKNLELTMQEIGQQKKVIRVGISIIFAKLFPDLLKAYQQKNPAVELKSYAFGSLELVNYVKNNSLDMAISGFLSDPELHSRHLLSTESYLWTNKKNPLSQSSLIYLDTDLKNEPIGLYRENIQIIGNPENIDLYPLTPDSHADVVCCTNQLGDIREKLLSDSISTFLPVHTLDDCPTLVSIPIEPKARFNISAYWKNDNIYSYTLEFIDYLETYISSYYRSETTREGESVE